MSKTYSGFAYLCLSQREYRILRAAVPAALLLGLIVGAAIAWWLK